MSYTQIITTTAALLTFSQLTFGVTIGQVDTFQSGLFNWFAGGGPLQQTPANSPDLIAAGGPAGAGDSYIQVNSGGGSGAGSRLVVMNGTQWAGNYLLAGVNRISMNVINLGATDLILRLYFEDPIPGPPANEAVTLAGFNLAAGSGWQTASFDINPSDFAVLSGNINTLLANTTIIRLMHNPVADFPPPAIAASLGIDNIAADAVPEISTMLSVGAGVALVLLSRLRRRR